MITATSQAVAARAARRAARGPTRPGSFGQQHQPGRVDVRGVDPGGRHHEAVVGLHDPRSGRAGPPPGRSRRPGPPRGRPRRSGPSAGTSTSRPSAFDTILLVTTRTSPSRSQGAAARDQRGQVVAGRSRRRCPRTGRTSSRPSRPPRQLQRRRATIAAVAVLVGHPQRHAPARSTPGTASPASLGSTSQPSSRPPVGCGRRTAPPTPAALHLDAEHRQALVGHAAHRRAADDRRHPDDRGRAGRRPPPGAPGTARIGAMLTTGLLGATSTTSAAAERLEHAGGRLGGLGADEDEPVGRARRRGAGPTTPGSGSPARSPSTSTTDVRLQPVVGGRQQPDAGLPAVAQRLGHRGQRIAGVRASGCAPGGWRCPCRRGRTRSARRRTSASSSLTVQVSPTRPQPRSGSAPPPRVYMTLSRSGQIRRPCRSTSSPTLTTAVTSAPDARGRTPGRRAGIGRRRCRRSRTTIRMSSILPYGTRQQPRWRPGRLGSTSASVRFARGRVP